MSISTFDHAIVDLWTRIGTRWIPWLGIQELLSWVRKVETD